MSLNILEAMREAVIVIKEYIDRKPTISYNENQTLTDAEKEQARANIDAASTNDIPDWALEKTKPVYTADEVGADPSGTANSTVSAHNTATDAHSDIRNAINAIPIAISEDGYTEITGLRQAISTSIVKSGNAITVTTALEGDEETISDITLDSEGYPTTIVTDGVECTISWEGFDASTATIDNILDEINGEVI